MPARRKAVNAAPPPPPDEERLAEAHEKASNAVAELDIAVRQELAHHDPKDPHIGCNVGVGSRQASFQDGEYAVDPETGVVLRRL